MYRVDREMDIREKLSICPLLAELPLRQTDVSERSFRAGQIISDRLGGIPAVGIAEFIDKRRMFRSLQPSG